MSYEIKLLTTASKFPQHQIIIRHFALRFALRSFDVNTTRGQTFGQIDNMCKMMELSSLLQENFNNVQQALSNIHKGYRSLLLSFYSGKTTAIKLAKRYRVTTPTVYRKLRIAKDSFVRALKRMGINEKWYDNYFVPLFDQLTDLDIPFAL